MKDTMKDIFKYIFTSYSCIKETNKQMDGLEVMISNIYWKYTYIQYIRIINNKYLKNKNILNIRILNLHLKNTDIEYLYINIYKSNKTFSVYSL